MRSTIATPAAFLLLLSGAALSRPETRSRTKVPSAAIWPRGVRPEKALPDTAALPACRPVRESGLEGGRRYDAVIVRQARRRGLDPRLVKAVIAAESQFSPGAVSRCGARGLMQVMPSTAEELGVRACDLSDPETNIAVGTEYLARLVEQARRRAGKEAPRERIVRRALAAYHSGPAVLGAAAWSEPTRRYVRTVLSCYGPPDGGSRPPRKAVAAR
jgi:soluble lytic murein transglycosylase-like protein